MSHITGRDLGTLKGLLRRHGAARVRGEVAEILEKKGGKRMAKRGRKVTFHGAFSSKADAVRKEKAGPGRFIRKIRVRGQTRYAVMSRR